MQIYKAHWLAPWFNHPFLATELTAAGPVLHLKHESHALAWDELSAPPRLEAARRLYRLRLLCTQGNIELGWLPGAVARPLAEAVTLGWFQHHGERVRPLAEHCLSVLEQGYLRHSRWRELKARVAAEPVDWSACPPPGALDDRTRAAFELVATLQGADESWLEQCRREYCRQLLAEYAALFDGLEAHPLTEAQRLACVVDDDHNLVLAGAGCGKTSVMAARSAFLLASRQARADELLLLAFGNEAAAEMAERLARRPETTPVKVSTFHALGLMILARVEGRTPSLSPLAQNDKARQGAFAAWLEQLGQDDPGYGERLLDWLRRHRFQVVPRPDFMRLAREWMPLVAALKLYGEPDPVELTPDQAEQLALVRPLLHRYQAQLAERGDIDFDDMIERAVEYVRRGRFEVPWRHILVDEFQDISRARAGLLLALRDAAPGLSLFCVGDDWQAIYRFSGADVSLTTGFAQVFGASAVTALDRTFRFNNRIEQVASRFVTRNPGQLAKRLAAQRHSEGPCVHVLPVDHDSQMDAVSRLLAQIAAQRPEASVYLLARFRFALPDASQLAGWQRRFPGLTLEAQTLHGAKGKEADCVILLGLSRGKYGFPPEKSGSELLDLLLPEQEPFPHAEERRLFYVGLTRARDQVFLLADRQIPSVFVKELLDGGYPGVSRWS